MKINLSVLSKVKDNLSLDKNREEIKRLMENHCEKYREIDLFRTV